MTHINTLYYAVCLRFIGLLVLLYFWIYLVPLNYLIKSSTHYFYILFLPILLVIQSLFGQFHFACIIDVSITFSLFFVCISTEELCCNWWLIDLKCVIINCVCFCFLTGNWMKWQGALHIIARTVLEGNLDGSFRRHYLFWLNSLWLWRDIGTSLEFGR